MVNRLWQAHGNSQEMNSGGSDFAHGYVGLYEAGAAVPTDLTTRFNTGPEEWISDQATVLAAKRIGAVNIVTIRPWAYLPADYLSLFGNDANAWAAHITPFLDTYIAAGFMVVCITSYASSAQSNINRAAQDPLIRSWVGTHCTAVADVASDPILGNDATRDDLTYFEPGGHLTDAGQAILYSYFAPVMDSIGPGGRLLWSSRR